MAPRRPGAGLVRRLGLIAGASLLLAGCAAFLPYADDTRLPTPVEVADSTPERAALNARVYDTAVRWVASNFYKRDFGGVDWAGEAAGRRDAAVAQPTERDFYLALNETLDVLGDRHTSATPPGLYLERRRRRLEPTPNMGLGMRFIDGQLIVTSIRPDGPGERASVRRGWRVESLNGEPPTRSSRLRRDLDAQVVVFTDGQDVEHELTLSSAPLPPFLGAAERRPDGVLVLSFDYFGPATRVWFDEQMAAALADPPKGIVIDLRDNAGGVVTDVGRALAHFFPERQAYAYIEYRFLPRIPTRTRRLRQTWTGPVAVVIGDGSASGAEVFAATIQETGRGRIVGVKSMGAVIASGQLNLPDGGELSIGMRNFHSGAGNLLEGVGVTPDREVRFRADELRQGRDAMIEAAVEAVLTPSAPDGADPGSGLEGARPR